MFLLSLSSLLPQLSIAKMDPLSQVFCLRWNNHRSNLLTVFDHLLQTEAFCDVTLACDGASVKCHKMILSACSSYFQSLFMENACEHPIVFLKDIKYEEIRAILDYMYKGEVNVAQEQLPGELSYLYCVWTLLQPKLMLASIMHVFSAYNLCTLTCFWDI